MSRTVCVVTGTRAEYGLLRSTMERIRDSPEMDLEILVTGMHLSPQHGQTATIIEEEGFEITERVDMLVDGDTGLAMAKSTGVGLMGIAESLRRTDPDVVLVLGDRDEPLAAAIAAAHMNIPIAHIHGGDKLSGAVVDESIRHALTKFAHLHFPASSESADRIRKLGEQEWRITVVGAPGLDAVLDGQYVSGTDIRTELSIPPEKSLILCVQHPVTTAPDRAGEQMQLTVDAVQSFEAVPVYIYPNSDAGSQQIIEILEGHGVASGGHVFENLPRDRYFGLLDAADVLVGNSSSGIIEAPSFDLPVVDVGPRQEGRQRAENVRSVPHDQSAIRNAIDECLHDESTRQRARECSNPYDYGGAGEQIATVLSEIELDQRLLRKELTY